MLLGQRHFQDGEGTFGNGVRNEGGGQGWTQLGCVDIFFRVQLDSGHRWRHQRQGLDRAHVRSFLFFNFCFVTVQSETEQIIVFPVSCSRDNKAMIFAAGQTTKMSVVTWQTFQLHLFIQVENSARASDLNGLGRLNQLGMLQGHLVRQLIGQKTPNMDSRTVRCQQEVTGPKCQTGVDVLVVVSCRRESREERKKARAPQSDFVVKSYGEYASISTRIDAFRDAANVSKSSNGFPSEAFAKFPEFGFAFFSASHLQWQRKF